MRTKNRAKVNSGLIESVMAPGCYITRGLKCNITPKKPSYTTGRTGTKAQRKAAPGLFGAIRMKPRQPSTVTVPHVDESGKSNSRSIYTPHVGNKQLRKASSKTTGGGK